MAFNTKSRVRAVMNSNALRASLESNHFVDSDVETVGGARIQIVDSENPALESRMQLDVSEANLEGLEQAALESHRLDAVKQQEVVDSLTEALKPQAEITPTLVGHHVFVANTANIQDPKVQLLLEQGLQAVASSPDEASMAVIHDPSDPRLENLPENLRETVKSALEHPEVAVLPRPEVLPELVAQNPSVESFRQALAEYKQK